MLEQHHQSTATALDSNDFESTNRYRLSLVLATKDRPEFLREALENATQLKSARDELIVVDGSTESDESARVIAGCDAVDYYIHEPDRSEANAFNKGFLNARGKYIKLLTDDDVIFPEALEKAINVLEDNLHVDAIICGGTKIRNGQSRVIFLPQGTNYGSMESVFRYGASGIGLIFRRKVLAVSGLISVSALAADTHLVTNIVANGGVLKFCRINLYEHTQHPHSFVVAREKELRGDHAALRAKYLGKWSQRRTITKARIRRTIANIPLLRRLYHSTVGRPGKPTIPKIEWDGGFS